MAFNFMLIIWLQRPLEVLLVTWQPQETRSAFSKTTNPFTAFISFVLFLHIIMAYI